MTKYKKPEYMQQIKSTDLTEIEKSFVDGLLELAELSFSYDGMSENIAYCLHHFATALDPVIEAQELALDAALGIEYKGKDGEIMDSDFILTTAQVRFKNEVTMLERNLNLAEELKVLLDTASRITHQKSSEYSERIVALRLSVEEAIVELKHYITSCRQSAEE